MKVRYYGFLSPTSKVTLAEVRTKIELAYGFELAEPEVELEPLQPMKCQHCGSTLKYIFFILPKRNMQGGPPG
jgi:hypothetical protein